jgi:hypothetical protein
MIFANANVMDGWTDGMRGDDMCYSERGRRGVTGCGVEDVKTFK